MNDPKKSFMENLKEACVTTHTFEEFRAAVSRIDDAPSLEESVKIALEHSADDKTRIMKLREYDDKSRVNDMRKYSQDKVIEEYESIIKYDRDTIDGLDDRVRELFIRSRMYMDEVERLRNQLKEQQENN